MELGVLLGIVIGSVALLMLGAALLVLTLIRRSKVRDEARDHRGCCGCCCCCLLGKTEEETGLTDDSEDPASSNPGNYGTNQYQPIPSRQILDSGATTSTGIAGNETRKERDSTHQPRSTNDPDRHSSSSQSSSPSIGPVDHHSPPSPNTLQTDLTEQQVGGVAIATLAYASLNLPPSSQDGASSLAAYDTFGTSVASSIVVLQDEEESEKVADGGSGVDESDEDTTLRDVSGAAGNEQSASLESTSAEGLSEVGWGEGHNKTDESPNVCSTVSSGAEGDEKTEESRLVSGIAVSYGTVSGLSETRGTALVDSSSGGPTEVSEPRNMQGEQSPEQDQEEEETSSTTGSTSHDSFQSALSETCSFKSALSDTEEGFLSDSTAASSTIDDAIAGIGMATAGEHGKIAAALGGENVAVSLDGKVDTILDDKTPSASESDTPDASDNDA